MEHDQKLAIELQDFEREKDRRIDNVEHRATLCSYDFWQLQSQRRRQEMVDPVLAAYLRAKLIHAKIVSKPEARRSFVTGDSAVICRIDNQLPRCLHLYHWTPPIWHCAVSTGNWLGATLIGMAQGQVANGIEVIHTNVNELLRFQ